MFFIKIELYFHLEKNWSAQNWSSLTALAKPVTAKVPYDVTEFVYLFMLVVLNNLRGRHTDTQVHTIHTYVQVADGTQEKVNNGISNFL